MDNMHPCQTCGKPVFKRPSRLRIRPSVFCSRECLKARPLFKCFHCGKPVHRKPSHVQQHAFCSRECYYTERSSIMPAQKRGKESPFWRGGTMRAGYLFIKQPDHPNARKDGYVGVHRLVLSEKIGRPLRQGEVSHHDNENTLDNSAENLQLKTAGDHGREHRARELHGWRVHTDGCVECGTKDRRHWAHGLCVRCYMRQRARTKTAIQLQ